MKRLLRSLLGQADPAPTADVRLAVAALMVEAATLDGNFGAEERERVLGLLARSFRFDAAAAERLLAEAQGVAERSVQLVGMTRLVKDSFDHDQRVELLEMLWEVVYADGQLHDYEANLLRRLAGLLYVSDQEAGAARKRVLARMGLADGLA